MKYLLLALLLIPSTVYAKDVTLSFTDEETALLEKRITRRDPTVDDVVENHVRGLLSDIRFREAEKKRLILRIEDIEEKYDEVKDELPPFPEDKKPMGLRDLV